MDQSCYERVKKYCIEHQLIKSGDGIIIGLSGGADSVFLANFLRKLQEEYELKLHAVHVKHGIRGAEADDDEAFARECAENLGINYESFDYDVPELAKKNKMSEEEAGRYYRYQCFREVAEVSGCRKIAVAHHKDDQAETVLFQLLRGSGLRGMGGIRPCQDDIIRPLLVMTRREIEEVLRADGIAWREDSTNREMTYSRNKLRLQVIPYLQKELQAEAVEHIAGTAEQLQGVWEYLHRQIQAEFLSLVHREVGRLWFGRSEFMNIDPVLQPYILLEIMEEAAGSRKDLSRVHVQAWMDLIRGDTGKKISLPYGLQAGRDYEVIWIAQTDLEEKQIFPWEIQMKRCLRQELPMEIPKNNCTKWFDYAKINSDVLWRHPMPGDYLVIDQSGHKKKLSRILLDAKVPRAQRKQLWVLADGRSVLWIPQIRRTGMGYYVTKETQEIFVVNIMEKGGTHGERDYSQNVFGGTSESQN